MNYHNYTCNKCGHHVQIASESMMSPLSNRLALHSTLSVKYDEAYYNSISEVVQHHKAISRTCHGALIYNLVNPVQSQKMITVAYEKIKYAHEESAQYAKGQQAIGVNTICAGVDTGSNKSKKGVNAHSLSLNQLDPKLKTRLERTEKMEGWSITNCAEIQAVDRLLKKGAQMSDIRVHSVDQFGQSKPPCENCKSWLVSDGNGAFKIRN